MNKPRGGKRPGAGRPKLYAEPTVPMRAPASLVPWIQANMDKIRKMKEDEEKR